MSPSAYGIFAGSTIHEVAQVVAAGHAISDEAANTAVIAKMVRVMMLAPFLIDALGLSVPLDRTLLATSPRQCMSTRPRVKSPPHRDSVVRPRLRRGGRSEFAGHACPSVGGQRSDRHRHRDARDGDGCARPGHAHLGAIRKAGAKPLLLALILFGWLIVGGALINRWVPALLG